MCLMLMFFFFFFYSYAAHRALHSFPTRRSSDLYLFDIHLTTALVFDAGVYLAVVGDRKSTRLNSSHVAISYAVFCLKKKKITIRVEKYEYDIRYQSLDTRLICCLIFTQLCVYFI